MNKNKQEEKGKKGNNEYKDEHVEDVKSDSNNFYSENRDSDDAYFTTSTKWIPIYASGNSKNIVNVVEVNQKLLI